MKKIIILTALLFSTAVCSNIFGQQAAPPGAGDKDLRDNNVKNRSIDLERVDRDANKTSNSEVKANAAAEDKLAAKYAEIKEDFEQIQLSQDLVIKAYQSNNKIDYAQIGKSALEINKSSRRLNSNLFPAIKNENPDPEKESENEKTESKTAKSVRDLIVELDNIIGSFAASPMFQNLRLIDPKVNIKTMMDLKKITELSAYLSAEAKKSAAAGN